MAITFWPRSWPSWPILATRMRGLAALGLGERVDGLAGARRSAGLLAGLLAVHAGDGTDLAGVAAEHLLQRVGDLPDGGLRAGGVDGERQQVARRCAARPSAIARRRRSARRRAASTAPASRSARSRAQLVELLGAHLGVVDLEHVDLLVGGRRRYLLTPITGWRPESMRAWVRAAASSIRSFGMPASMALAMPPAASTSSMCAQARRASS